VLALAVAVSAVAVGVVAGHGRHDPVRPPKAVLGHSLLPLAVYRVAVGADPAHLHQGQRLVPDMGRAGHSTVVQRSPVTALHVTYARVRPVRGHWQIEFLAPEGATFNAQSTQGAFYDVVINGKALTLFFLVGSADGTDFGIGAGADRLTEERAVAVARTLTSSVSVAHCSQSAIDANECA
jgi:hypothetical protein